MILSPQHLVNAAVLCARLGRFVGHALTRKIKRRAYRTDSSTVRNWIRATFVPFLPTKPVSATELEESKLQTDGSLRAAVCTRPPQPVRCSNQIGLWRRRHPSRMARRFCSPSRTWGGLAEIPAMDCHYRRAPHRKVSSTPLVLSAGKMWISRKRTSTPFPNSRATSSC